MISIESHNFSRGVGAIVIRATYGDNIYRAHGTELTELNNKTLELVTWVSTQFWLVNFIPSRMPVYSPHTGLT